MHGIQLYMKRALFSFKVELYLALLMSNIIVVLDYESATGKFTSYIKMLH